MQPEVMRQAFENVTLSDAEKVAKKILQAALGQRVFILHGELGAGKTTLVKAMCKSLGVEEAMSSPTFSIVNEYMSTAGETLYHFDFYRIKQEAEAYDIGIEEYFDSGNYCFIEWPEKIPSLLPLQYIELSLSLKDETHRTIVFSIHD